MKKKKGRAASLFLFLLFLAGLSLLLYPTVANYWNSMHQTRAIARYSESVANMDGEKYDALLQSAHDFNSRITQRDNVFVLSDEEAGNYEKLLNIGGTGVMGYIEIPQIDVALPIYHGTGEGVLQIAVGHIDWTSLPVGGKGTHCVLSGHRGLPSAQLFTHLDQLAAGDVFILRVLDEILTYEVDQILIVEPKDTDALQIVPGKDYCTLVTCTPYGINTHRLLVRGHRIENAEEAAVVHITSEAVQIEPLIVASVLGIPTIMLLLIIAFLSGGKKGNRKEEKTDEKKKE